ncbi:MAG TPA: FUSC family protein, partial [Dongiaceae bacterium]
LTNWPQGSTAAVLGAVATARLATMGPAVPIALVGSVIFALSAIPAFIIVEVLLPLANGFAMFALAVAPMLFFCAFLMAHKKTVLIGYLSALLFASAGQFLDRMVYDPVGFINTAIAAVVAAATAMVLWAIVAPATPTAARRRFGRAARKAFEAIARRRPHFGLTEFETAMTEALDQLRRGLNPNRGEDVAAVEAGIALLGTGRELIRIRDDDRPGPAVIDAERDVARFLARQERPTFDRARRAAQDAAAACLAGLRDDKLGVAQARAVAREMVAFAAMRDALERGGELLLGEKSKGVSRHAA